MKKIIFAAILLGIAVFFCGYSTYRDDVNGRTAPLRKLNDLDSKIFRLGLPLGAKAMYVGEEEFTEARPCYFNSHHAAYAALLQGKIDGYLFDSHTLDYVASQSPDYAVLPGSLGRVDISIGVAQKNADLLAPINQFIDQYKQDGTYQAMYTRWMKPESRTETGFTPPAVPEMPRIEPPADPTRTLVVGTCSQLEPLCFRPRGSDQFTGFDMELLRRLAQHLNVRYVIRDLDYITMMDELAKGELDIVVAGLNKTEERIQRQILFSKNYIDSHIVALVRSAQIPAATADSNK